MYLFIERERERERERARALLGSILARSASRLDSAPSPHRSEPATRDEG